MATLNEADLMGKAPALIAASTTEQYVVLDHRRSYAVAHDGVNVSGTTDANTVWLSKVGGITADYSAEDDKFSLKDGRVVTIGPGWNKLYFICASGAPVLSVMPAPHEKGDF